MTTDHGMAIEPTREVRYDKRKVGDRPEVLVATDASFAPGGSKSRTGIIVMVNNIIVHWMTGRQDRTALSTCEAEIMAHRTGVQIGLVLRDLVKEATQEEVMMKLEGDNTGALRSVVTEITAWRTKHYAGDAAWVREKLEEEGITVHHRPGKALIADGLTKVLPREVIEQFRERAAFLSRSGCKR